MSKVRVHMMISADGYVAGPNQAPDKPFGDIPEGFLRWVFELRSFRQDHGMEGGKDGPSSDVLGETSANLGATIIGRNMFGGGTGPWPEPAWDGWWGENPPYHTSVFVITHHPRAPLVMQGGTTFHFVTAGIESALDQARVAAGERDIRIGGGANVVNQYLAAGLIDEIELHVVPFILGGGARLFDNIGSPPPELEVIRVVPSPEATHIKYRVIRD
ncbi:MAG TPA: dihydrofolate reductase family protein [Dehalococcoidia bacterium]|nr:dihydrofolate reductase family protein [Dehalococcoidia bacterium]